MSHENGKYYKAADKVQLIASLLDEKLSTADRVELQKKIATQSGLSYRTIGRYVERFRKDKLPGLVLTFNCNFCYGFANFEFHVL